MIQPFVDSYMKHKDKLREVFRKGHPENYMHVVRSVVEVLDEDDSYDKPDPLKIEEFGGGDYSGTLMFIITGQGAYNDNYWYVKVGYGSCSGCDTLQRICGYTDDLPTEEQVDGYMTLALHIVQKIKKFDDTETV